MQRYAMVIVECKWREATGAGDIHVPAERGVVYHLVVRVGAMDRVGLWMGLDSNYGIHLVAGCVVCGSAVSAARPHV